MKLSRFLEIGKSVCSLCSRPLRSSPRELIFLFLCRHVVHASCVSGGDDLPLPPDASSAARGLSGSIALFVFFFLLFFLIVRSEIFPIMLYSESMIKAKLNQGGCPVCHRNGEGRRIL